MVAIVLGLILPSPITEVESAKTTSTWRIIFGVPLILYVIQLILFCTIIRSESIKFLLDKGREDEALDLIKKIYCADQDHEEILE